MSNVGDSMTLAAEQAIFDMRSYIQEKHGENAVLSTELLAEIVGVGVRCFMSKWYESLQGSNLSGLIEIVLSGQKLPPDEIKAFVRALPTSLLKRITESAVGIGNGYHGLMAIEYHRRMATIADYTVGQDYDHRAFVEFNHFRKGDEEPSLVKFYLDEKFDLGEVDESPAKTGSSAG